MTGDGWRRRFTHRGGATSFWNLQHRQFAYPQTRPARAEVRAFDGSRCPSPGVACVYVCMFVCMCVQEIFLKCQICECYRQAQPATSERNTKHNIKPPTCSSDEFFAALIMSSSCKNKEEKNLEGGKCAERIFFQGIQTFVVMDFILLNVRNTEPSMSEK